MQRYIKLLFFAPNNYRSTTCFFVKPGISGNPFPIGSIVIAGKDWSVDGTALAKNYCCSFSNHQYECFTTGAQIKPDQLAVILTYKIFWNDH